MNYNISNEITKKEFEKYLKLDNRLSMESVFKKIRNIRKYEVFTKFEDFKTFDENQGLEFVDSYKKNDISLNTISRAFIDIKEFFIWLSKHKNYKKNVKIENVRVFNLSRKETKEANIKGIVEFASLEEIYEAVFNMPYKTEKDRRNRAIVCFAILTGARVSALMTLKIGSINKHKSYAEQDPAMGVKTKASKYILTRFFSVDKRIKDICIDWLDYLKSEKGFKRKDALFPAMKSGLRKDGSLGIVGFSRDCMKSDTTIRNIIEDAFESAGLKRYHPHSFRHTLIDLGYKRCNTTEDFKAWSQNLGHNSVLTTLTSYGTLPNEIQMNVMERIEKNN